MVVLLAVVEVGAVVVVVLPEVMVLDVSGAAVVFTFRRPSVLPKLLVTTELKQ